MPGVVGDQAAGFRRAPDSRRVSVSDQKIRAPAIHYASAQSIQILLNEIATHLGDVGVRQALRDRTRRAAITDVGAVEAAHAGDAEACGGQEHPFGVRRVEEIAGNGSPQDVAAPAGVDGLVL